MEVETAKKEDMQDMPKEAMAKTDTGIMGDVEVMVDVVEVLGDMVEVMVEVVEVMGDVEVTEIQEVHRKVMAQVKVELQVKVDTQAKKEVKTEDIMETVQIMETWET